MSKRKLISTWRQVTKVKLSKGGKMRIGSGIYDTNSFTPEKVYEVIGVVWYSYEDRSGDYCYLVQDDSGTIEPRAMKNFEVVEIKEK